MFDKDQTIAQFDAELWQAIQQEDQRQEQHIELIASENYTSPAVMEAQGGKMTNKYAEGYPSKRYYGGCEYVDIAEDLAIERLKSLYKADFANVQPHSGSQANSAVFLALIKGGDTILGMSLADGGHLTHGAKPNFSGKLYNSVQYGLNAETGLIDYDQVEALAIEHKPAMIIAGFSAYSGIMDWARFREIADKVGAYLMVDMAHVSGLIAAGVYPSPVPHAHVVTSTTHKTLRGPRGGIILTNDEEIAKKCNSALFPGSQGGPLCHVIAAKAVAFKEAASEEFVAYQKQVVANAKAMAATFMERGINIVSNGTENHLMLVSLIGKEYSFVWGGIASKYKLYLDGKLIGQQSQYTPHKPLKMINPNINTFKVTKKNKYLSSTKYSLFYEAMLAFDNLVFFTFELCSKCLNLWKTASIFWMWLNGYCWIKGMLQLHLEWFYF